MVSLLPARRSSAAGAAAKAGAPSSSEQASPNRGSATSMPGSETPASKLRFRRTVDAPKGGSTPIVLPASGPLEAACHFHKAKSGTELAGEFFGGLQPSSARAQADLQSQVHKLSTEKLQLQRELQQAERARAAAATATPPSPSSPAPPSQEEPGPVPQVQTKAAVTEVAKLKAVNARLAEDNAELAVQMEQLERRHNSGKAVVVEGPDRAALLRLEAENQSLHRDNSELAADLERTNRVASYVGGRVAKMLVDARKTNNYHAARNGELERTNRKLEAENQRLAAIVDRLNARGSDIFSDTASQLSDASIFRERDDMTRTDSVGLVKRLDGHNRGLGLLPPDAVGMQDLSQSTNSRSSSSTAGSSRGRSALAQNMAAELDRTTAELTAALAALQKAEDAKERAAGMAGQMEVLGREAKVGRELRDDNFRLEEALVRAQQQVAELEHEVEAMEEEAERLSEGVQRGVQAQSSLAEAQREMNGLHAQLLEATSVVKAQLQTNKELAEETQAVKAQMGALKAQSDALKGTQLALERDAALVPSLNTKVAELASAVRAQEALKAELQEAKQAQKEHAAALEAQWKARVEQQERAAGAEQLAEQLRKRLAELEENNRLLTEQAALLQTTSSSEANELQKRVVAAEEAARQARARALNSRPLVETRSQQVQTTSVSVEDPPAEGRPRRGKEAPECENTPLPAAAGRDSRQAAEEPRERKSVSEAADRLAEETAVAGAEPDKGSSPPVPATPPREVGKGMSQRAAGLWHSFMTRKGVQERTMTRELQKVDELMVKTATQQVQNAWEDCVPDRNVCRFMSVLGYAGFDTREAAERPLRLNLREALAATQATTERASAWDEAVAETAHSYLLQWPQ